MAHIRNRFGMLACAALLSFAGASQAATFDISYTFGSNDTLTGTVDGTLNGSFIDDITNIHLAYDGDAFADALTITAWDPLDSQPDAAGAARISTDASQNNFLITGTSGNYEFLFVNGDANLGQAIFAADAVLTTNNAAFDSPVGASWSVTAAPVPEPASLALLIAGLGVVGTVARRRRTV